MVKNTGETNNEAAFWKTFTGIYGEKVKNDLPVFDEFYRVDFNQVQKVCGLNPLAARTVSHLKEMGLRVVLATNPLFPSIATENRIRWAGLKPEDFELYTTYENSCYCKPNPNYYREILNRLGLKAEECLMVGNDAKEDMIAQTLGMKVFLLTDCLINPENKDISEYPQGDFDALVNYIEHVKEPQMSAELPGSTPCQA